MPGGCCYGNASAIAMIGHSCLINWFFNASWFVRTLKEQAHGKWKINGFLFPSLFPLYFFLSVSLSLFSVVLLLLVKLFPYVLRSVVMVFWIMIGSWRLLWMGEVGWERLVIWNAKGMSLFMAAFCEQLLRQTRNLMSCEYYEFLKQVRASYNITLLCIFILEIYWDQLWLESRAFISEPPLVFIKTSYAWALSIWSF